MVPANIPKTLPSAPLYSLVIPVYNEEVNVDALVGRSLKALSQLGESFEIILVNDGSGDNTLAKLLRWREQDPRVRILDLTRNFGHQRAIFAGLSYCQGEVVSIIDGDLQDPPELLPEMVRLLEAQEAEVVYAVRRSREEGGPKALAYWAAYRVMKGMMGMSMPLDSGDFSVMKRPVLEALLRMPEQSLYLRGLRSWVGFRQVPFAYDRAARAAGEPKYRWKDLFRLAYNGIFSFTHMPIKFLGFLGTLAIAFSALYLGYLMIAWFLGKPSPPGFTTLILAILFFSGVQLVGLRILGAYIHRIFDETRQRPLFLARRFYN